MLTRSRPSSTGSSDWSSRRRLHGQPFSMLELLARVKAIFRRAELERARAGRRRPTHPFWRFVLDPAAGSSRGDERIALTPRSSTPLRLRVHPGASTPVPSSRPRLGYGTASMRPTSPRTSTAAGEDRARSGSSAHIQTVWGVATDSRTQLAVRSIGFMRTLFGRLVVAELVFGTSRHSDSSRSSSSRTAISSRPDAAPESCVGRRVSAQRARTLRSDLGHAPHVHEALSGSARTTRRSISTGCHRPGRFSARRLVPRTWPRPRSTCAPRAPALRTGGASVLRRRPLEPFGRRCSRRGRGDPASPSGYLYVILRAMRPRSCSVPDAAPLSASRLRSRLA